MGGLAGEGEERCEGCASGSGMSLRRLFLDGWDGGLWSVRMGVGLDGWCRGGLGVEVSVLSSSGGVSAGSLL